MSLGIEDGFNFTIGEWLAELTIFMISLGIAIVFGIVVTLSFWIFELWNNRRSR